MSIHDSDFKPSTRFGKITGKHALAGFVLIFAVVFGVNGLMVYRALSTFDGVEVEGAYQKGRAYNHVLEQMEAQRKLGWSAGIETRMLPGEAPRALLSVSFTDAEGRPVEGLAVHGTFWRPVVSGQDKRLPLAEAAPGVYEGVFTLAGEGNWQVRVAAAGPNGETFVDEKRIVARN